MYLLLFFLAPVGFCASIAPNPYGDPHCNDRQVIVHLFEWKWIDIAAECERYLGPKGFCGVQISPPNENVVVTSDESRPWWERYQPVSYKLDTRSGDESTFKDMVDRCKAVGVRIYADVVINHMAAFDRSGTGTGGSLFNGAVGEFPGVPFSARHFHTFSDCGARGDIDYQDAKQVRNCDLFGLKDLDHSQSYVQDKVAEYLNKLIDLGVAGFRVDAAKHMWPRDIAAIQKKVNDLPEGGRPFFYFEVIDWNTEAVKDDEYFDLGYVTEFRYEQMVREAIVHLNRLKSIPDSKQSMVPSNQALVFVDNHDTQRQSGKLSYKNGREYQRAVAFTLANDYGLVKIMSSYSFNSFSQGPPHEPDFSIKNVSINSDGSCGNGWVCEHRWNMVGNLARFRTAVRGEKVTNWFYHNRVLSFSRGDNGFFAMGLGFPPVTRNTSLPEGEYCDLISDCAMSVKVDKNGYALIRPAVPWEPFVALLKDEKTSIRNETKAADIHKDDLDSGDIHKYLSKSDDIDNHDTKPDDNEEDNTKPEGSDKNNPKSYAADKDDMKSEDIDKDDIKSVDIDKDNPKSEDIDKDGKKPKNSNKGKRNDEKSTGLDKESDQTKSNILQSVEDFRRTVIVFKRETTYGQNIFIRGGIGQALTSATGCTTTAATSPCSIPIRHVQQYKTSHYFPVNAWSKGDHFLDWIGAEPGQGEYNGQPADGTPAFWSTDDPTHEGFNALNRWGLHHWIVDIEMDCNKTEKGYFEVSALVSGQWETWLKPPALPCTGNAAPDLLPFDSLFHIGRCGYLNVFEYGKKECQIELLP